MSSNLFERPHNLVVLQFTIANVGAGATPVDGVLVGGFKGGPIVPTGMKFVPVFIDAEINDARTAGTSTIKVTGGAVELVGGPEALIDDTNTLADTGGVTGTPASVAAGVEVGVSATGSGTFAPTTADADVLVYGYYLPA
jgi:hypothetical protein